MNDLPTRTVSLDRLAIGLSGLCAAHCLISAAVLALAASAGGVLLDPVIHEVGLVLAILLGALSLGRGIGRHGSVLPAAVGGVGLGVMAGAVLMPHSEWEIVYTIVGVAILAFGHHLNRRAQR